MPPLQTPSKYLLDPEKISYQLPEGATLLTVRTQRHLPFFWALVDPEAPKIMRRIQSYGTGHEIPARPGTYIGSFFLDAFNDDGGGVMGVFHVFDEGEF